MSAETETDDAGAPGAGAEGKDKGKHKGKGPKWFTGPHRDQILVISSVVLVLLGYLTLRRSGGSGGSAPVPVGTSGSAMQAAYLANGGGVAGFDQSAIQGLQTMLANQADQLVGLQNGVSTLAAGGYTATPGPLASKPIAAGLFAPIGTGNYVHLGNGIGAEVESDGSLFGITSEQWQRIISSDPNANSKITKIGGVPNFFSTEKNLATANAPKVP